MQKETTNAVPSSRPTFEALESYARGAIETWLQQILEEEVDELLGRRRYERKAPVDPHRGYRNGYGKRRRLSMSCGTITVRRPRVRDLDERFESRILPLFQRRTKEVGELLPELYLHGLSQGDFDLALRGLLGEGAPLSASSIARLKGKWQTEYESWKTRSLEGLEVVYLWVDGIYVKAGLEKEKAAVLVAIAGLRCGRKVVLTLEAGHRESTASWSAILRALKARGMSPPKLVIGDGHLGIWGGLANVFPEAEEQRCWNHRIVNVLDRVPKKLQPEAAALVTPIPYAKTREEAERLKKKFQSWAKRKELLRAGELLDQDWERMVSFYRFPKEHWKHIRTTNPVESPFAAVRLRTSAAKRFKKIENATAVIWKLLLVAEKRFRRLDAPHLLADVADGRKFKNGIAVKGKKKNQEGKAA